MASFNYDSHLSANLEPRVCLVCMVTSRGRVLTENVGHGVAVRLPAVSPLIREWILLALCLGLGGHIALGVILHSRDLWSLKDAGLNGLLAGVGLYLIVQLLRSLWWAIRAFTNPRPGNQNRPV